VEPTRYAPDEQVLDPVIGEGAGDASEVEGGDD
jgi:hypothetical protein